MKKASILRIDAFFLSQSFSVASDFPSYGTFFYAKTVGMGFAILLAEMSLQKATLAISIRQLIHLIDQFFALHFPVSPPCSMFMIFYRI